MATGEGVEKFIVSLGFSDKDAVKGLKNFLKTVNESKVNIKPRVSNQSGKSVSAEIRNENALLAAQNSLRGKILVAEKQGIAVGSFKQSLDRAKTTETLTKRRLQLEKEIQIVRDKVFKRGPSTTSADEKLLDAKARQKLEYDHTEALHRNKMRNEKSLKTAREKAHSEAITTNRKIDNFTSSRAMLLNERLSPTFKNNRVRGVSALKSGDARRFNLLKDAVNESNKALVKYTKTAKKANVAQRGLSDSTKHLIRSYVSVFALLGATNSINRVGQQFEALDSAMLAAMGSKEDAAKQIAFLDELTSRLGMSLIDTADQYTKFTFAAKGKLPTEEVNFLFQSMAEMGTVLGVSKERMKLSFTAIQQMMNKSTISSEELKRQFAESMPGGIQLFANAIGKSEKELFKLMESGSLLAKDVLPKVALEMQKVANKAGALDEKYKTTRVAQGRFFKQLETANKEVFRGGFDEGFAGLLNEMASGLDNSESALASFGQVFKALFNILNGLAKVLIPVLRGLTWTLGKFAEVLNLILDTSIGQYIIGIVALFKGFKMAAGAISLASTAVKGLGISFGVANVAATGLLATVTTLLARIAPLVVALGTLDELYSYFDDTRTNRSEKRTGKQGFSGGVDGTIKDILRINPFEAAVQDILSFIKPKVEVVNNISVDGVDAYAQSALSIQNKSALVQR